MDPDGGAKVNADQPPIQDCRMTCSVVYLIIQDRHWFVACFLFSNVEEYAPEVTRRNVWIHVLIFSTYWIPRAEDW